MSLILVTSVYSSASAGKDYRVLFNMCSGRFLDLRSPLAEHSERNQASLSPRPHGSKEARQNHGRFSQTGAFSFFSSLNYSRCVVLHRRRSARNRHSRCGLDHSIRSAARSRVFCSSSGSNSACREERTIAAVLRIHRRGVRVVHTTKRRSFDRMGGKMGRNGTNRIAGDVAIDSREMCEGSRLVREKRDWICSQCASRRERIASWIGVSKSRL